MARILNSFQPPCIQYFRNALLSPTFLNFSFCSLLEMLTVSAQPKSNPVYCTSQLMYSFLKHFSTMQANSHYFTVFSPYFGHHSVCSTVMPMLLIQDVYLIYSSAPPGAVLHTQQVLGTHSVKGYKMIKWHRANMISYLSGLMLTMQVLGSAVWIPVPELYL